MKRFWKTVTVEEANGGYQIALDGRAIRTQGGEPQIVPSRALAEAMAEEWSRQAEQVAPEQFVYRDIADFAIDQVRQDRLTTIETLLRYGETDTLCYRADPDEALYRRQRELWDPLLGALEARHAVRLEPVSGVIHRPQRADTMRRLREVLGAQDDFTLAALHTLAPLAASLAVALAAIEPEADARELFSAANCEQDWQAELWGWDLEAERVRDRRLAAFEAAARFAYLARS